MVRGRPGCDPRPLLGRHLCSLSRRGVAVLRKRPQEQPRDPPGRSGGRDPRDTRCPRQRGQSCNARGRSASRCRAGPGRVPAQRPLRRDPAGTRWARPCWPGSPAPAPQEIRRRCRAKSGRPWQVRAGRDRSRSPARGRRSSAAFQPEGGTDPILLLVEGDTTPVEETLESIRRALLRYGALGLLLAVLGGYWLATRALRPIDAMTRQAGRMAAASPSTTARRLDVPNSRDELGRLAATFNLLLERNRVLDEPNEGLHRRCRSRAEDASVDRPRRLGAGPVG